MDPCDCCPLCLLTAAGTPPTNYTLDFDAGCAPHKTTATAGGGGGAIIAIIQALIANGPALIALVMQIIGMFKKSPAAAKLLVGKMAALDDADKLTSNRVARIGASLDSMLAEAGDPAP